MVYLYTWVLCASHKLNLEAYKSMKKSFCGCVSSIQVPVLYELKDFYVVLFDIKDEQIKSKLSKNESNDLTSICQKLDTILLCSNVPKEIVEDEKDADMLHEEFLNEANIHGKENKDALMMMLANLVSEDSEVWDVACCVYKNKKKKLSVLAEDVGVEGNSGVEKDAEEEVEGEAGKEGEGPEKL